MMDIKKMKEIAARRRGGKDYVSAELNYLDMCNNNIDNLLDYIEKLEDCRACLDHALEMGHFTEGGSMEGWAKSALKATEQE
jgi:hypothetical protein